MTTDRLFSLLSKAKSYDLMFNTSATTKNGMKISIQGKCIIDSIFLFKSLSEYLYLNNIPFKIATSKRFDLVNSNKEQSYKSMTIYNTDGFDFSKLLEDVYTLTLDYKGWYNINTPKSYEHYAGGLFFRNDRDVNGCYIAAN